MSECVVRMDIDEMPTACGPCELSCTAICKEWTKVDRKEIGRTKSPNCPILAILPEGHGRLVDADAFEKDVSDALVYGLREIPSEEGKQIFHVLMQEVLDNVKKRETIVPAERSDT